MIPYMIADNVFASYLNLKIFFLHSFCVYFFLSNNVGRFYFSFDAFGF